MTPPCATQQELIARVQHHLIRLSDLMRSASTFLAERDQAKAFEVDRNIELEIGEKERAMGALRQHCREHGCGSQQPNT